MDSALASGAFALLLQRKLVQERRIKILGEKIEEGCQFTCMPTVSPEMARPSGARTATAQVEGVGRQRSLVEDDADSERVPARTVCAAFSLLVLGLILLCMSVNFFMRGHPGSLPFLLLGIVVIVPGAFSSFQLIAAFRRWPGYDFEDMHARGDFV